MSSLRFVKSSTNLQPESVEAEPRDQTGPVGGFDEGAKAQIGWSWGSFPNRASDSLPGKDDYSILHPTLLLYSTCRLIPGVFGLSDIHAKRL